MSKHNVELILGVSDDNGEFVEKRREIVRAEDMGKFFKHDHEAVRMRCRTRDAGNAPVTVFA